MSFLVDTNVLSELVRPVPQARVVKWAEGLDGFSVSVVTIDELFFGLTVKPNVRVQTWLEAFLQDYCRVLDVTNPVARHAGILRGHLAARGQVRTQADMLIAATATQHGLTLATRNEKDFVGCGLAVLNPFRIA